MLKKISLILLLVAAVLGFMNRERIMTFFLKEGRTINTVEKKLLIKEDPTLYSLSSLLFYEGIVSSEDEVKSYILENNIDTTNFAAGKYIILSGTKMSTLINGFLKNEEGQGNAEVKVNVIFNRCKTIEDIGGAISKCIAADSASIVEAIQSDEILNKYDFTIEQIPALFLPKDYEMYFDTDAKGFISFMAERFKKFWTAERYEKLKAIGLKSPSQAVTVASIVYSEQSRNTEEWPIIAKLYLNRLNKGMLLQSDPTFKFCWGDRLDGVERLLNKHKQIDCPYNTYLYAGLPPGPICIPPAEVIDAVLNPADVNYLFMCGKPGGNGHNFAVTNAQHERNAAEYRVWLKEYLRNK